MSKVLFILLTLLVVAVLGAAGAAVVVWRGWYDVSATGGHTRPVYRLLHTTLSLAVFRRARNIEPPALDEPARVSRGAACYRDHCEQCHGGPGVAPSSLGMSLQPLPGPLVDAARRWHPNEIYWITRHGIKMSGMPAWELRLPDDDLWAVTAFLQGLPGQTPAAYREAMAAQPERCRTLNEACAAGDCADRPSADQSPLVPRSRDEAARLALRQYACVTCHRIPGVVGPESDVGPPLAGWAARERIAGRLPNTADALVQFIRHPQRVKAGTAMPELGVTEPHARLMAEYLLKQN